MTTSSPTPEPNRSAKGWNNKRGRAERGRADTHVTAHDGRAVCFVTGEPSGLTATLPKALAELKKTLTAGAQIMLGFDRGGAYPAGFHPLPQTGRALGHLPAGTAGRPRHAPGHHHHHHRRTTATIAWADEKVQLKDYGDARQITLFEHGRVVLQILTSDFDACPAAHPGLAEVAVAGRELPQVRQPELRHRHDLRLRCRHRGEYQDHRQPGPQDREHPPSAARKTSSPPPSVPSPSLLSRPGHHPRRKNAS